MIKFLETIKRQIQEWHEEHASRIESNRQAALDVEARETVQVMEYNGELYVSVNGVPLFRKDNVIGSLTEAVAEARETYKDWKEERLWTRMNVVH